MLKICIIYDMMLTNEIMQKKVVKHVFKKEWKCKDSNHLQTKQ